MTSAKQTYTVAFASSVGADLTVLHVDADDHEAHAIDTLLSRLTTFGHVVAWSLRAVSPMPAAYATHVLRERFGDFLVDVAQRGPQATSSPAFLVPVWPFDHKVNGQLAATAEFLGHTLEVVATPSSDEEVGALLPGRDGLWLIRAHPMF